MVADLNFTPNQGESFQVVRRCGNSETKVGLDLPDLQLGDPQSCIEECEEGHTSVFFPIENTGQNHVADEIVVQVQTQNGTVDVVSIPHLQSDSVYWIGPYDLSETDFLEGVVVSIDGADLVYECVENNNSRTFYDFPCEQWSNLEHPQSNHLLSTLFR